MLYHESFDRATNVGMKSDVLRYEILWRYGGVYVDVDYECLENIDQLSDSSSFFCCFSNTTVVEINNGIFGYDIHNLA
jgi:mannosyltransferase OCH1-like enzyme